MSKVVEQQLGFAFRCLAPKRTSKVGQLFSIRKQIAAEDQCYTEQVYQRLAKYQVRRKITAKRQKQQHKQQYAPPKYCDAIVRRVKFKVRRLQNREQISCGHSTQMQQCLKEIPHQSKHSTQLSQVFSNELELSRDQLSNFLPCPCHRCGVLAQKKLVQLDSLLQKPSDDEANHSYASRKTSVYTLQSGNEQSDQMTAEHMDCQVDATVGKSSHDVGTCNQPTYTVQCASQSMHSRQSSQPLMQFGLSQNVSKCAQQVQQMIHSISGCGLEHIATKPGVYNVVKGPNCIGNVLHLSQKWDSYCDEQLRYSSKIRKWVVVSKCKAHVEKQTKQSQFRGQIQAYDMLQEQSSARQATTQQMPQQPQPPQSALLHSAFHMQQALKQSYAENNQQQLYIQQPDKYFMQCQPLNSTTAMHRYNSVPHPPKTSDVSVPSRFGNYLSRVASKRNEFGVKNKAITATDFFQLVSFVDECAKQQCISHWVNLQKKK